MRKWGKRLLKAGLGAVAVWGVSQLVYRVTNPPAPAQPLLIAHRGGAAYAPENTVLAFAFSKGYVWETDVRQTSDGVLVLMHDGTVDRTTRGHGPVENLTGAQAQQLGIATFAQYLELAQKFGASLLPEVKGSTPGLAEAVARALTEAHLVDRTTVQSFSLDALQRVHATNPNLKLCRLYYPWGAWVGDNPEGVVAVAPMAEMLLLNPWMVRQAHARGWQVWPWFACLESDFTVRWILGLGVDGVIVDDPRR